jgi:hypothetical protein
VLPESKNEFAALALVSPIEALPSAKLPAPF